MKSKRHGRERTRRGHLESFSGLPTDVQNKFKTLAKEVMTADPTVKETYVFGSYYWGFWDEESDFDIAIDKKEFTMNKYDFKEMIIKKHGYHGDICIGIPNFPKYEKIKIPV